MIIYVCDRCHKKIPDTETINKINMAVDNEFMKPPKRMKIELCRDCYMDMMMFLDGEKLAEDEQPKKEEKVIETPPEKPKPKKKPKAAATTKSDHAETEQIDEGKCRALFRAKWPIEKIAEEMRVDQETVKGVLNEPKR